MIKRPNPLANVSLAAPEMPKADFGVPNIQFSQMQPLPTPAAEGSDTGSQITGLGSSLLKLKQKFGAGKMAGGSMSGASSPLGDTIA